MSKLCSTWVSGEMIEVESWRRTVVVAYPTVRNKPVRSSHSVLPGSDIKWVEVNRPWGREAPIFASWSEFYGEVLGFGMG